MKAEEAKKLTHAHSERMQKIYASIKSNAGKGLSELILHTGEVTVSEIGVLRELGYSANYETAEIDGGQYVLVKW